MHFARQVSCGRRLSSRYNKGVKFVTLLFCGFGLLLAQQGPQRDGNFDIRFEPTAKLQTGVRVPFQIDVKDGRKQPLAGAKVTLQIGMLDGSRVQVFPAPALTPGVYISKPVFPAAGDWSVYVEVRRNDEMSSRAIQFSVADAAP